LENAGKGDAPVAKTVQNLQNNVDFINKMNHVFTYIQLPLKMSGNNAHGDLYIYTNKKNLAAKDGNVSALLHLDMEHLGPLDVYVAMQNNKVSTNFTVQDESALDLIEEHIGLLDERLTKRGYALKAQFQMKEEQADDSPEGIMQTILNQEKNISVLSRTSFDMRA
jgi:flagellar hook-length control protein FliK